MSAKNIDTFVLLFPNEEWSSGETNDQLDQVVSQLRPNISFAQTIDQDSLQTLSTHNAPEKHIKGFLYVPDLEPDSLCYNISEAYVPHNVTRQANLPPTDFTLIAIAPWVLGYPECSQAYLASARQDPARAFVFFLPGNGTTQPPSIHSPVWGLEDGGRWKTTNPFPIYAVPSDIGALMLHELAAYSGNMTAVPHGNEIASLPNIDPRGYVRLYTKISLFPSSGLPGIWTYILIIVAVLVAMLTLISVTMHLIQRSRRSALRRRVISGEVNLEALGIKRLTVPQEYIDRLPLFIYVHEEKTIVYESTDPKEFEPHVSPNSSHNLLTASDPPSKEIDEIAKKDAHKFLPYAQPTCVICLDDFVSKQSTIRELPCGHIFHIECIDSFLSNNSSLCSLCKASILPPGYCPEISNLIVRRERNVRRLRPRVAVIEEEAAPGSIDHRSRVRKISSGFRGLVSYSSAPTGEMGSTIHLQQPQQAVVMTSAIPPNPGTSLLGREISELPSPRLGRRDIAQRSIRALAAQENISEYPETINGHNRPKWRIALGQAFPGFS